MRALRRSTVVAFSLFVVSYSVAGAQDQKALLASCIDLSFADLVTARSKNFSSPQFRVICDLSKSVGDPPQCEIDERNESFTDEAPAGFSIAEARFKVVVKGAGTSVGDLETQGTRSSIILQCRGRECDKIQGHTGVAGNIVGRLAYQPTAEDAKNIAGACLDQVLR